MHMTKPERFQFIKASELLKTPPGDEIPELLRYSALCIEAGVLGSAAWRLADASAMLRRRMERRGYKDEEGLDCPTGRGTVLGHFVQSPIRRNAKTETCSDKAKEIQE